MLNTPLPPRHPPLRTHWGRDSCCTHRTSFPSLHRLLASLSSLPVTADPPLWPRFLAPLGFSLQEARRRWGGSAEAQGSRAARREGPALPQLLVRPDLRGTRTQRRLPPHRQKLTRLRQSSQSPSHHLIPGPSHKASIGTHGGNHTPHPSVPGRSPPTAEGLRPGPGEGHPCPASRLTPLARPRPAVDPALRHRKGQCRNRRTQSVTGPEGPETAQGFPLSPRPPRAGAMAQEPPRRPSRDRLLSRMLCAQGRAPPYSTERRPEVPGGDLGAEAERKVREGSAAAAVTSPVRQRTGCSSRRARRSRPTAPPHSLPRGPSGVAGASRSLTRCRQLAGDTGALGLRASAAGRDEGQRTNSKEKQKRLDPNSLIHQMKEPQEESDRIRWDI